MFDASGVVSWKNPSSWVCFCIRECVSFNVFYSLSCFSPLWIFTYKHILKDVLLICVVRWCRFCFKLYTVRMCVQFISNAAGLSAAQFSCKSFCFSEYIFISNLTILKRIWRLWYAMVFGSFFHWGGIFLCWAKSYSWSILSCHLVGPLAVCFLRSPFLHISSSYKTIFALELYSCF